MAGYVYVLIQGSFSKVLKRENDPVPTVDDITPILCGATIFTKLDALWGCWNVNLAKESQALTTLPMHKGRYKLIRRPFGLRMSQDIFQRKIDQTLENCQGAGGIANEIKVFGDDATHGLHEGNGENQEGRYQMKF